MENLKVLLDPLKIVHFLYAYPGNALRKAAG